MPYPSSLETVASADLPTFDAVQLFAHCARRLDAGFSPTEAEYYQIARVCQLLHGTPLAINLAAGWIGDYSCQAIADEIKADLDFLVSSLQDVPDRHQSLRSVFEHSWKLLSEAQQAILRRLAVFQGHFRRAAAREVAGADFYQLSALANKSFLHADPAGRYGLHPLLKQYLAEKLTAVPVEAEKTRGAHAQYFARFLQKCEPALVIHQQTTVVNQVGAEIEDVLAAWEWAITQGDFDILDRSLDSLYIFFWARNKFREGKVVFEQAAEAIALHGVPVHGQRLQTRIHNRLAEFLLWLGDLAGAQQLLQAGIATFRYLDEKELALALELLGRVYYWQGDLDAARETLDEGLAVARRSGAQHHTAQALTTLANSLCEAGADLEMAQALYQESLTLYQQLDNPFGIAKVLINQGAACYDQGDYTQAQHLYRRSLEIYRQVNYAYGISAALNNLAIVTRKLGDLPAAKELVEESLALKRETGNCNAILHSLLEVGMLNTVMGEYKQAHQHYRKALQMAQEIQATLLLFHVLLGLATLYMEMGQKERAAELVTFVCLQDGLGQEARTQAGELLVELEADLGIEKLARCRAQGEAASLTDMLTSLEY